MSTHSKLLGSVSLLATALATLQCAWAQDQTIETVTVTGIRAAIVQGLEIKRESNVIVESIAAEDIGKMPDANLAEALQRVPGVSIDRDGGEGRYVTIRGLGPDFNTLLLNGRRIATTEYTRSFAFDTISSDMVGGMNVYKTQQSFIREGGVGGTVDVRTLRPMDHPGFHATGRIEFNHSDNNGKTLPQGSALFSDTFLNDTLGVLVSGSYQRRENRTFTVGTDRLLSKGVFASWTPLGSEVPDEYRGLFMGDVQGWTDWSGYSDYGLGQSYAPMDLERTVTDDQRERIGMTAAAQWRPNDNMEFNVDILYSKFNVVTDQKTVGNWFWNFMPPASAADYIKSNWTYYNYAYSAWFGYPGNYSTTGAASSFADYIAANSQTTRDSNGVVTYANTMNGAGEQHFNGFRSHRPTLTQSIGLNFKWDVSSKLKLTFDAAWSSAGNRNSGIDQRRSLEKVNVGSLTYVNTGGTPYTIASPELAANATDSNVYFRNEYNSGTDILATNQEISADAEYKPSDNWTFRFGVIYEQGKKRAWYYQTPNNVPCNSAIASSTGIGTMSACHISDYYTIYNNPYYSQNGPYWTAWNWTNNSVALTQAQYGGLIDGVYSPNPKDFGMAASADVKTLLLNYGAMEDFAAANYASQSFAGQGCSAPRTGAAVVCSAAMQADAIATYADYIADHGGNPFAAEKTGVGYIVTERVTSAYFNVIKQGDLWSKAYVLTLGMRYAHTETHSAGYSQNPIKLAREADAPGSQFYSRLQAFYDYSNSANRWTPSVTLETADSSYDNFLPDIDFKLNLTDNLIWRAGASQSLSRPALDLLAPSLSITSLAYGANASAITKNNPHLKPLLSTNFDTAAEWYYGQGNAITFDAYWKNLKGLIAYGVTEGVTLPSITTGADLTTFEQTSPINAKAVTVYGATLGWTHSFEFGLGWQVNYTWTGTDWSFNPNTWSSAEITLPGLSNAFNAVLFYEKHGLGIRVAYNWRAKFLAQTNFQTGNEWYNVTNTEPVFVRSYQQVDARVAYAVLDNAEVYIEGTNLLNEPVTKVGRFDNLIISRDNYGSNIVVGYSMKF